jgi:multisubunit Na+/H+ antiporter MnhC subunit
MTAKNIVAIIIGIEIMTKGVTLLLAASGYFGGKRNSPEFYYSYDYYRSSHTYYSFGADRKYSKKI